MARTVLEAVMIPSMVKTWHLLLISLLLSTSLILGACANKAKMIQVGATQFEAESLAAIERIDELRRKEIEAMPLPPEKASAFFVQGVKNSAKPITLATLRVLTTPLATETPTSEAQWQAFLQKMRQQYTTFAATFASLDKGSWFAAAEVKETIPILDKLIAQMAAFARSIQNHPAEFMRERAAIAAEVEQVRQIRPFTEITDLKLLELERRLRETAAAEEQITRDTVEQALKAATLGIELRKLLVNYDQLSLDDISEGLSIAFKLVAGIPGLDLSGLNVATNELIGEIEKDESLRGFFKTALSEISRKSTPG
jgi:hypothetical protein